VVTSAEPACTKRISVAGVGGALIVTGLLLGTSIGQGQVDNAATAFGLVWVGCLILLSWNHPAGVYCPSALYLLVFGLFHGGLLFSVAVRGYQSLVAPADQDWVFGHYLPEAVRLSIGGCVAYLAAVQWARARLARELVGERPPTVPPAQRTRVGAVGLGAEVFGLCLMVYGIQSAGGALTVLQSGYNSYLRAADNNTSVSYALVLIGIGAGLAVMGTPAQRRAGLLVFAVFALVAFPLGLRGEVLFPLAIVVAVEVRQGRRVPTVLAVPAVLVILVLIGLVRQTRAEGVTSLFRDGWFSSPMDSVAEMGHSLYPTVVVERWHDTGEPFAHGVTLVAVPIRLIERLTGWHGGPPAPDYRLFNVEILNRVGPIGGSLIAEGYRNAGLLV
jgi:hypothetical protein